MAEDDSEGWQIKVSICKAKKKEKNDDGEGEEKKEKGKGSVGAEGGAPPPATSADQAPGTAGEPAATSLPARGAGATAADAARRASDPTRRHCSAQHLWHSHAQGRFGFENARTHRLPLPGYALQRVRGPRTHGGRKIAANDTWALVSFGTSHPPAQQAGRKRASVGTTGPTTLASKALELATAKPAVVGPQRLVTRPALVGPQQLLARDRLGLGSPRQLGGGGAAQPCMWEEGHTSPSYPPNEDRWQGREWEAGDATPSYPHNEDRWRGRAWDH